MLAVIKNSADAPSDRPPASTSKVSRSIGSAAAMPRSSPVVALIYEPFMAPTLRRHRYTAIGFLLLRPEEQQVTLLASASPR
jgi:hypothetical protein